ncbi:MAG TPA: hypothetical protein PK919_06235 [Candidatus Aminicenantes bacterium]|nr:hypothetical protein [Candidatus Aminicenantes bacterium]
MATERCGLSRLTLPALLLALATAPAGAELLKLSQLQRPAPRFTVKRDLFAGAETPAPARAGKQEETQSQSLQQSIAEEIASSVSFEGIILKGGKPLALLNVSGEYHTVGEGETILGKIRVLTITRERVTIEYDGQPYEIRKKGEE